MDPQQPTPQPNPQVPGAPQLPPRSGGFTFNDFITFRYLITPTLITIVYIIGAVLITLGGLAAMVKGGAGGLLLGLLVVVFGNLYWRVIAEFVMVLFRMNDSLKSIDRRGKGM
jgi:hypothetical protein